MLITLGVVVLSWIFEVYAWNVVDPETGQEVAVQSLLEPEGIRWWLKHVTDNFVAFPTLGPVVMLLSGAGMAVHSGWLSTCLRYFGFSLQGVSRKERRSLWYSWGVLAGYFLLVLLATFSSWAVLRGIDGGLSRSPFMSGSLFLLTLAVVLAGMTYGFSVGRYRTDDEFFHGFARFIHPLAFYLLLAFFASQLQACFSYSHLDLLFRFCDTDVLTPCIVHLPFVLTLLREIRKWMNKDG